MLDIIYGFNAITNLYDDFEYYDRQEEYRMRGIELQDKYVFRRDRAGTNFKKPKKKKKKL